MTIQSPKKPCTGYNPDTPPDFHHENQHITPQNNFAKKSLNSGNFKEMPILRAFQGGKLKMGIKWG